MHVVAGCVDAPRGDHISLGPGSRPNFKAAQRICPCVPSAERHRHTNISSTHQSKISHCSPFSPVLL